jgi:arylsulfatase A-like enzyme
MLLEILAGLVLLAQHARTVPPGPAEPSVLVVVLDDVGHDGVEAVCENARALADQGLSFRRFYAYPVCSASRYAALFGRVPRAAGIGHTIDAFSENGGPSPAPDASELTLAERLQPTHATALFGKWHLGRGLPALGTSSGPFVQGFDAWRAGTPNSVAFGPAGADGYYDWFRVDDGVEQPNHAYHATLAQRDEFLAWWQATRGRKFAWLALNAAHSPYDTPPGYTALNPLDPRKTRARYLQVLDHADSVLGSVLAAVDLRTTFVLVFGDNGLPDDARVVGSPTLRHKGTTYEGGIRVPCVLAGPGISPGVSDRLVSVQDVPATVCELLGLEQAWPASRSMLSGKPRSWVFSEVYDTPSTGRDDLAVVEADWKLRRCDPDGAGPEPSRDELYRLSLDPGELAPIDPASAPAEYERLLARLGTLPARGH